MKKAFISFFPLSLLCVISFPIVMKRDIVLTNSHTKERGERVSFVFFFLVNFVLCVCFFFGV